jgi:hypothetical protein
MMRSGKAGSSEACCASSLPSVAHPAWISKSTEINNIFTADALIDHPSNKKSRIASAGTSIPVAR